MAHPADIYFSVAKLIHVHLDKKKEKSQNFLCMEVINILTHDEKKKKKF